MKGLVRHSIADSISYWKIILIVYFFQLLLAITIGLQVFQVIDASIGDSISTQKLLASFDYTVVNDFLIHHGASISPLIGQMRWLILIYLIFSIFINAGILYTIHTKSITWLTFFEGGALYFFRFLRLSLFFLFLFMVWSGILWFPALGNSTDLLEALPNEKYYLLILLFIFILYIIGIAYVYVWSIGSKLYIMEWSESNVWMAIISGFKWSRRNYITSHILLLSIIALVVIIALIYFVINQSVGMVSVFTIVFIFIIQQAFILFRITSRFMIYLGLDRLFRSSIKL